jgi:hypothetical protein
MEEKKQVKRVTRLQVDRHPWNEGGMEIEIKTTLLFK